MVRPTTVFQRVASEVASSLISSPIRGNQSQWRFHCAPALRGLCPGSSNGARADRTAALTSRTHHGREAHGLAFSPFELYWACRGFTYTPGSYIALSMLTPTSQNICCPDQHCTGKKTVAQRGQAACPRTHSR